jgi:hypothetical protein
MAMVLLATQACGSDDGKKKLMPGEAGMAGEGGSNGPDAGGSAAGEPQPNDGGDAGTGGGGQPAAGAGGEPMAGSAGAGGEPSLPEPELLFSVKPGAIGIPTSAVDESDNPHNTIFTSSTGSQDLVDGTNAVKITGVELGLSPDDQITAFALPQPEPEHPLYLFSVADGAEGARPTRTYLDYWTDGDEQSNLYYSDGVEGYRYQGEGGDEYGYNGLLATQTSIGLSRGGEAPTDDLTGLMAHDAREPITELYFTVGAGALGAEGSALADVPENERACTVFKSSLDGKQSVAFSCTQLGLLPDDRIDALAIVVQEGAPNVVFSVSTSSVGAVGSAVESINVDRSIGATLFGSTGNDTNVVYLEARKLGLAEYVTDEVDGFTLIDAPQPSVAHADGCTFDSGPLALAPGGELLSVDAVTHIGDGVMLLQGSITGGVVRELAYDVGTCAELGRQDMVESFLNAAGIVAVPLAGWSKGKPLEKLEYWRVTDDDAATSRVLRRFDATGQLVKELPIPNMPVGPYVYAAIHDPVHARLFVFSDGNDYNDRVDVLTVPGESAEQVEIETSYATTLPCATGERITGLDAAGNYYMAQQQLDDVSFRVCSVTPFGELRPVPYLWTSEQGGSNGFVTAGGDYYLLNLGETPGIERGAFTAP